MNSFCFNYVKRLSSEFIRPDHGIDLATVMIFECGDEMESSFHCKKRTLTLDGLLRPLKGQSSQRQVEGSVSNDLLLRFPSCFLEVVSHVCI